MHCSVKRRFDITNILRLDAPAYQILKEKIKGVQMKALRIAGLTLVGLALLAGFGARVAAADGPVASAVPVYAPYMDNQIHTLGPKESALFRFDYHVSDPSNRPVTTIILRYGNDSGVDFEVWTPDDVTNMADNKPIGRGSPFMVGCVDGLCTSPDSIWAGSFGGSGTYYVRVINTNSATTTAKLLISGDGVSLAPAPIAVTGPSVGAQSIVASAVPVNPTPYLDNQIHTLGPKESALFRFDYHVSDPSNLPVTTIIMRYGHDSGVNFEVWTPDDVTNMADNDPIGRGSSFMVACVDGLCTSPDSIWAGSFGGSGTYYVRVINTNSTTTTAKLLISGDGVSLAPAVPIAVTGASESAQPAMMNAAVTSPSASTQPVLNMDDIAKAWEGDW